MTLSELDLMDAKPGRKLPNHFRDFALRLPNEYTREEAAPRRSYRDRVGSVKFVVRAVLITLLWALSAQSCPARGYAGDGPDRDLAEVQKTKGVEVQIDEVNGSGDLPIMYLSEGPRIIRTPVVQFHFKFLPQNALFGQGPFKEYEEMNRRSAGKGKFRESEIRLMGVVLCTRDKDERTLAVTLLAIQEDRSGVEEGKQGSVSVEFAISKDLLEHSFLRLIEFNGVARQATDLYLGRKPKPDAPRYRGDPVMDSALKAPTEAKQPAGPLPLIPGLPCPTGK